MSLAALLREVRALHDLPRLLAGLGYEPLWQELPDGALVARAGDFIWTAWARLPGQERAASRASRLARGGRVAGVVAFDAGERALEFAVGFHGEPWHRVPLDAPTPVDLARLERLRPGRAEPGLVVAARVADALAGEEAGRRFFREFRRILIAVRDDLPEAMPATDRHALALLQLTRILVLYFVQAKGWLDGRERFLREEVDRCMARGGAIHRDLLRPLFFGALNRAGPERSRAVGRMGRIPFLNGGLFEPHPLERRWRGDLPTRTWLTAFDDLFERFHFVTRADGGPGIAPDMLGQVFEGVMEPELRLASGSYYTPAPLVNALLVEGFTALLATRLRIGAAMAERQVLDPSPAARSLLERVTVLDPAVGSGAFLLGALEILAAPWQGHPATAASRKRAIVSRNLFGVDQNANAVRLAELRLWLEVIAADPGEAPEEVEPLPNLDALLRQGDSLADPSGLGTPRTQDHAAALGELRRRLASATGPDKRAVVRALRAAERQAFLTGLSQAEEGATLRIADLLQRARSPNLFGARTGLDRTGRRDLAALRRERARYRSLQRRGRQDDLLPWFHYQSHFADVFAAGGGFDLVVGNPPWVRAERVEPERRAALAARYRWWRGPSTSGGGYAHRPDLAVAFLERATELVAPGGAVAMLVPAKLATADYAVAARAELAARTTLRLVADLTGDPSSAFDATVYPLALVYSKDPPPPGHRVRGGCAPGVRIPQVRLGGGPWILVPDPLRDALEQVRADHPRLEDRYPCHLGIKTGCNRIFLDPAAEIEPELLRWAIRGRDVSAFRVEPRRRLLWTHAANGDPLPALPPLAAAWIRTHQRALVGRRDYTGGPPWGVFRAGPASSGHRVVWADLARRLEAAALVQPGADSALPLNSCYLLVPPTRAAALRITAWLNCTWLRSAARVGADPAASGFARFNARVVGGLPVPHSVLLDPDLAALAEAGRADRLRQEDLDDIAARHLTLGPAHRRALAGDLGPRTGAGR
jgi:hypothetical protein